MDQERLFYTGGAIPPIHSCYVERMADYEVAQILQNNGIVYIIAPRQMGKTSLLIRLQAKLKLRGWSCCRVDLATLKGLGQQKWFQKLGSRIGQACGIAEMPVRIEDQQDFRDFLLDTIGLAQPNTNIKLALLLDEAEGLLGLEHSDAFLMTLRDLYQSRYDYPGQLLLMFTGAIDPDVLVKDPTISPFNVAHEVALTDFGADESEALSLRLGDLGLPVEKEVHQRIHFWTSGQPYLTQRLCQTVESWVESRNLTTVTPSVIDDAVHQGLLHPEHEDKNIKHVKSSIGRLSPHASALWLRLRSEQSVSSSEPGYYALYLTGVAIRDREGQVRIRNRVYSEALKNWRPTLRNSPNPSQSRQLEDLREEYEAASEELRQTLDPTHKVRLARRLRELEEEIQKLDDGVARL